MESKRFWWWLNCLLHMCWIMHWVMFSQEQNRRERLMRGWWNDECPLFCLPEMVNNSRPYPRRKQVCFINFLFNTYSTGGSGWLPLMVNILPVEGWQFIPINFQGFSPIRWSWVLLTHQFLQLPEAMAKDRKFDSSHGTNSYGTGTNSSSPSGDLVNVSSGTSGSRPMLRKRSSCSLVSLPNQDAEGEKRLHQSPGSPISALERFDKFWQRWDFWGRGG